MQHITIIAVGKIKEKYLAEGLAEYLKRLEPFARVKIIEIDDEKCSSAPGTAEIEQVKEVEGRKILTAMAEDTYYIALDMHGLMWKSAELAAHISSLGLAGQNRIGFIIGGSHGLASAVLARADMKLSFGKMTYPHQLMRRILCEQIYRSFKIIRGEPYHK
jgi:23S rRNA (pseudouridine1915-N3)-methyltransferase